jgi:hypothetical protein
MLRAGSGWPTCLALARTNSRTVYKYIYLIKLIIYNNILFIYIKTTQYLCMHFILMYAFYICLAVYLVFIYYERIKCIYIFSIYINMRAAVGPTHLSGRAGPKHAGRRICPYLSAFRDRGVPKPTSECRCVPQPRWVERVGEREGGKRGGRRRA